jgi:hypothetical protein
MTRNYAIEIDEVKIVILLSFAEVFIFVLG